MSTALTAPAAAVRRWPAWTTAAVLTLTAVIHIVAGTGDYLNAVDRSGLAGEARGLAIALWHLTSVLLVLLAVAVLLGRAADHSRRTSGPGRGLVDLPGLRRHHARRRPRRRRRHRALMQWTLFVPGLVLLPLTRLPHADT